MLGPVTVGKKAASWGDRKYGVPGAVATGAVGVTGYLAARRVVSNRVGADDASGAGGADGSASSGDVVSR